MNATAVILLLAGVCVGAAIGALWARGRSAAEIATLRAQSGLGDRFETLAAQALDRSGRELASLADERLGAAGKPIREGLDRLDVRLREIEQAWVAAQAMLAQQVDEVRVTGEQLRTQTAALVTALRKPEVRGRWGEMHLRRAVEVAGLVERCDFDAQATMAHEDGVHRPDLVVHLAGGKHVVVDAKVPLAAFLDAAEAEDIDERAAHALRHAKHVRAHVDQLASKAYWQSLSSVGLATPEFVVLFVPGEAFLSQALEYDRELLEDAAAKKVMIATPATLITLLRTVAYAWTQDALAANAREVFELGRSLYERIGSLGDHLDRLGRSLTGAVTAYNKTVGSLEARVLVTARKMHELKITDEELEAPKQITEIPRALSAEPLVASAEEGRAVRAMRHTG